MPITDQQWLDHSNQNVQEFSNRNILLRGDGPPSNIDDPAPFGSFYKNKLNGDRYEQIEVDPISNGYNWQLFETGGSATNADKIVRERNCDISLSIGDLVWEGLTDGEVDECINNTDKRRVIGICIDKPSDTVASIMFSGEITGLSGLINTQKVYCSPTGTITSTLPSSGYIQTLGDAGGTGKVDFLPAHNRIKRS